MHNMSTLELLRLLEQQERTVSSLYTTFAALFPAYQNFWLNIAEEEQQHARWIKALSYKVSDGTLGTREHVIHAAAVRSSMAFITKQIERAKRGELSALNAFSIAMSIEDDMLEKRFFKVFLPQEAPFKEAMHKLMHATHEHREDMRRQFNRVRAESKTASFAQSTGPQRKEERHAAETGTHR